LSPGEETRARRRDAAEDVTNCPKIGLVPIVLPAEVVETLMRAVARGESLTVDLEAQQVSGPDDLVVPFEFDRSRASRCSKGSTTSR
jgi:3-isopropylmalate/(R)-2-methylmalate dehydratase small subunit